MLRGLVDPEKLTSEQKDHIDMLQDEIDEIWNRKGDYTIDPDAWEQMPIFMENITEDDIIQNENCAALSSIVYDEVPPEEVAENRKEHGNRALVMALNPSQERRENLARAACHSYTEALQAKSKDMQLTSTIYANRSLAQFIIGNYGHGLEDAQRAIFLNPSYIKAYFRAAKCAERLKKYDIALKHLAHVRHLQPPLDAAALKELEELEVVCRKAKEQAESKAISQRRGERVQAAKVSNLARAITSEGIKLSSTQEVSSEQMSLFGNPRPYFDTDGQLHVPILFMYDEYQQTDIMHDVACDVSARELLEELMPFPWDNRGRYSRMEDILVCYKVDDGVHVPEYYEVPLDWPLMEVFRVETYQMPLPLTVLHVIAAHSELVSRFNVKRV